MNKAHKGSILFIMDSSMGHISASLRMAYLLHEQGYKIVYAISADATFLMKYFADQPFEYYPIYSWPLGFESYVNKVLNPKGKYLHTLLDKLSEKSYKQREKELSEMVKVLKPDFIFLDSLLSSDFLILYSVLKEREIGYALLQTMVSTKRIDTLPPLDSRIFPHQKTAIRWAWEKYHLKRMWRSTVRRIMYLGNDEIRYLRRKAKQNQVQREYPLDFRKLFAVGYKGVSEFILSSQEFDFASHHAKAYQYYLGPMVYDQRKEDLSDRYQASIMQVEKSQASNPQTKLIYCGLGSLYMKVPRLQKYVIPFVKKLYKAFAGNDLYQVFINIHQDLPLSFKITANNFHQFDSVPQIHLLQKADAFITHGGFNSIKEAIASQTPMLVYPLDPKFDQNGNAVRVTHNNLGLMGDLKKDSAEEIAKKLRTVVENPKFKAQLEDFEEIERSKYTDLGFLEAFYERMNKKPSVSRTLETVKQVDLLS